MLLTDGKSRNQRGPLSRDGNLLAYSSTRRNGTDSDLYGGAVVGTAPEGRGSFGRATLAISETIPQRPQDDNRCGIQRSARGVSFP